MDEDTISSSSISSTKWNGSGVYHDDGCVIIKRDVFKESLSHKTLCPMMLVFGDVDGIVSMEVVMGMDGIGGTKVWMV